MEETKKTKADRCIGDKKRYGEANPKEYRKDFS